jgi:formylglycine-generating enzyme required for sulfatase activity
VWYGDSSDPNGGYANNKTHEVGKKTDNELGIFDMSGNVWEWCWDRYGSYPVGPETDYTGAASGSFRVRRGGGWGYPASDCTVAIRNSIAPGSRGSYLGFRVVRAY